MATHILVMYTPLNGEGMENLFNLLTACPDDELLSALTEIEGDEPTSTWQQAEDEFKALQLQNAQQELNEALVELELAELQFQVIAKDLEDLQVYESMAKEARKIHQVYAKKLERVQRFLHIADSSADDPVEIPSESIEKANALKASYEKRLQFWSEEYALELEAKYAEAKAKFDSRGITLDDAKEALREAQETVDEAEALIERYQSDTSTNSTI